MKNIFKQEGYVLLLTLVLSFMLVLILSSLLIMSVTQANQVKKTEKAYASNSNAEMGIEYLDTVYKSGYIATQEIFKNEVENLINANNYNLENRQAHYKKVFFSQLIKNMQSSQEVMPYKYSILDTNANEFISIASINSQTVIPTNFISQDNKVTFKSASNIDNTKSEVTAIFDLLPSLHSGLSPSGSTRKPLPYNKIKTKFYEKYCGDNGKNCSESRIKGNSGNDKDLPVSYLSKDYIQIGMVKDFYEGNRGLLYANNKVEITSNQTEIGKYTIITDILNLPHSANAADKVFFKDTIIIIRELKMQGITGNEVKDKNRRDITLTGNSKICFIEQPTAPILNAIKGKITNGTNQNIFILTNSNYSQFFSSCGLSSSEFTEVISNNSIEFYIPDKLLQKIHY